MKKLLIATILVAVVVLSGCLSALHPLFTEKDLVFDPHLVGSWRVGADDGVYTFERAPRRVLGICRRACNDCGQSLPADH
jgi:hypothetical protein